MSLSYYLFTFSHLAQYKVTTFDKDTIVLCDCQGERLLRGSRRRKHHRGLWGFHWRNRRDLRFTQSSTSAFPNNAEGPEAGLADGLLYWREADFHPELHICLTSHKQKLQYKGSTEMFLWCFQITNVRETEAVTALKLVKGHAYSVTGAEEVKKKKEKPVYFKFCILFASN